MNNAISAEMTAEGISEPTEVLNARYNELEKQWQEMRAKRNNEVTRRLAELDQAHVPDPWIAAGIAGIYGKDPFSAYNQASLVPQAYQKEKYALLNENLSDQEKELASLMKSVQARMVAKSQNSRGFSGHTVDGGSYVLNNDTGKTEWVKAPVGATKFMTSVAKSMVDEAIKQGTYTPETRDKITLDAKNYYDLYTKAQPEVRMEIEKRFGLTEPSLMESLPPIVKPGSTVSIGDANLKGSGIFTPQQMEAIKADMVKDKTVLPHGSIVQPQQSSNVGTGMFKTPQQLANEKAMGEGEYKVYQDYKEKLNSLQNANQQISAMEGMLESDKLNSGLFHEELNKIGGFVNYIDPNNQLAKNAGNDAAYYSKMMDLVRDKIKALGAGTAVSNLDLIVTQKSVGDLRNTPQGNLKVMALMKLANATMGSVMDEKVAYYDQDKRNTFQGYKRDTTPTHAIRYRLLPNGNWAFDIEDKESWIERAKATNGGKLPSDINSRWKIYADNSVKNLADPDKLIKKGK